MLMEFNPIILDVAVIVLLLAMIAIGALKGIFHTSINFVLAAGAIALAFSPLLNVVKEPLVKLMVDKINLGAGVAEEAKMGAMLAYKMVVSVGLALALFIVFRLVKLIVRIIVKHRAKKNNKLLRSPHALSRVSGALVSLLLNGALVIVLLSIFATPLVGGNKTLEKTTVAKHVEKVDNLVVGVFVDDVEVAEHKMLVRMIKGNLFMKVSDETAKDLMAMSELLGKGKLAPSSLENIQEAVDALRHTLSLVDALALDEEGKVIDYAPAVEKLKDLVTNAVNQINALNEGGEKIAAEGTVKVHSLLQKLGLDEVAETFANNFEMH